VAVPEYSPRYEVTIGGTTYREAGGQVYSLKAQTTVDGAAMAEVTMSKPFDPGMLEFFDIETGIEPGMDFEIATGWGTGELTTQFVGKTRSVDTNFNMGKGGTIAVSGYGFLHEMMRDVKERSWSETSVPEVAQEVLEEYFSNVEVKGEGSERKRIIQQQTDYRFIRDLADDYGFEFYANYQDEPVVYFEPRSSLGGEADFELMYGQNFYEFDASQSTAEQVKRCDVRYYDPKKEKEFVGSCEQEVGEGKEVFRIACDSKEEAENIAKGKLSQLSMGRLKGNGMARGQPEIQAGDVVELKGLGEKFSGLYFVTKATDKIGDQGYRTTFKVRSIPEEQSVGEVMLDEMVSDMVSDAMDPSTGDEQNTGGNVPPVGEMDQMSGGPLGGAGDFVGDII